MDKHFVNLEKKIERAIAQCDSLRAENLQLRQDLLQKIDEMRHLSDKVEEAKHRLHQLMNKVAGDHE
ncbi:MAG: hypothetical protein B7Z60_06735 [Ferrovum sp. 37-45-19]|jgi:cell division protein ZapB|uniref:hypothetical protein n=1 Tax=Ferrovum sp. JA12 TaxID=1356299 RepID=UPI0007023E1B|nr:hypothetical protein [Ferrovum sp. JA12]OYV79348.1 MAG: hypothetical protein B7Z65_06395 [Ferrovum sp. 21-44-67]OYV94013.1 MAG: hypothetical protein B7Z60_06735 [Ferrovum sp. 37-45-19]OZB34452.1 MAG: hypothetical protein B7X47_00055 [Ferrovum sp. 34-44-207]HQT81849.1 hypothetical protein [Ferrovaceae bacterium]KRH79350.1 hypothetical protein FERRO_04150 [Ferrovum sp. JA12]